MRKNKSGNAILSAVSLVFLSLAVQSGHTQLVDRTDVEAVMRDLMPTNVRCGSILWEPTSYCRYETPNRPDVVVELSFGADGPAGSLTYNIENSEGRLFLRTIRLFFSEAGIQEKLLVECINQSKSKSFEVLAGNFLVKCRYADIADRVAYEIFAERI